MSTSVDGVVTLGAWFHDLSRFAWEFSPGLGLRWYGLSYIAGFLLAWVQLSWLARRGLTPLSVTRVMDAMLVLVIAVMVGGRLGYVVFYKPALLWTFTDAMPWWGVLRLQDGGMASHGGMIGVLAACWWIARGTKDRVTGGRVGRVSMLHVMDLVAFAAPAGLCFGRLANFVNGELLGKIVAKAGEPAPWWAVRYPQELLDGHKGEMARTAAQDAEVLKLAQGFTRAGEDVDVGIERMIATLQNAPAAEAKRLIAELEPLISARHPSQLYQAFAEGIVVSAVLWIVWRRPRASGVVAAWFLVVYGVGRVLTEVWRLPDAHLAVERIAGLSRGQWLSVAMVVAGVVLLAVRRNASGERWGGWGVKRAG